MTSERFCTHCGAKISAQADACERCGSSLTTACASCGTPNPSTNLFCAQCGSALSEPASTFTLSRPLIPETAQPLGDASSQRREVTIVFVDASNFTATSSQFDNEEVYGFVNEAMKLLVNVVHEYDGTIDKFTGDGLMALFGVPLAHENDAERAVRAAWEMQRIMNPFRERLRAEHGFDFRIRIGVHTGEVIAGRIGSDIHAEYTVIGDAVNLAARLETAAEPDTVYVSATTHARTASFLRYEAVPALRLKGIASPVDAYRVAGVEPPGAPERGIPGLRVPMVGRTSSLQKLSEEARRVRKRDALSVAWISGEAGLGKTRLVSEFLRTLDSRTTTILTARCIALTRSRPLQPIAELLRAVLELHESDPPQAHIDAVRAFISAYELPAEETAPYILNVLGIPDDDAEGQRLIQSLDEAMLHQQTNGAIRRVLLAAGRDALLVIFIDDLHWIDSASRDTLQYLCESAPAQPVLIICVSRTVAHVPELTPLVSACRRLGEQCLDMELQPLQPSDARELVRLLVPGESANARDLRRKITTRAEGNPFYVEELVRMLLERGVIAPADGGEWTITPQAEDILQAVPPTLRDIILSRFDALARELRLLMQRAAVLGRSFPARLLQHLVRDDVPNVMPLLAELEQRDFLRSESFGLERGFTFRHVLIQEAIHSTLLKRDRQKLHEEVATIVEEGQYWSAAERTGALAYHWAESTRPRKAVPYLLAAAEGSVRRHANEAAVEHCRRVLDILGPDSCDVDVLRARVTLGRAQRYLGRLAEADRSLQQANTSVARYLTEERVTPEMLRLRVEILRELGEVKAASGALDHAFRHLEEATLTLSQWSDAGTESQRAAVLERMAWVRFREGNLNDALLRADEVEKMLAKDPSADPVVLASLFNTLGGILWQFGKLDSAVDYVRRSLKLYRTIGYLFGKANAHTNLGVLHYAQGLWRDAADNFERSDFIRREIGYMVGRALNLMNLGLLRIAMGEHKQARADLETSLRISRQLGEEFEMIKSLLGLGHLAIIESRFADANAIVAELKRDHDATIPADDRAQAEWMRAMVLFASDPDDALNVAAYACRIARQSGVPETEADCARVMGTLHLKRGDRESAHASLRSSLALAQKLGDPYREALALLELGIATGAEGGSEEHLRYVEDAIRLFTQVGATYDLRRAVTTFNLGDRYGVV
jgi:class 3 adenylate cyclase/tetratricopeptide (TPR) repeat protein